MSGSEPVRRRRQNLPLLVSFADLRRAKGYTTASLCAAINARGVPLSLAQLGHIERGVRGTTPAVRDAILDLLATDDTYGKPVKPTLWTRDDVRDSLGASA